MGPRLIIKTSCYHAGRSIAVNPISASYGGVHAWRNVFSSYARRKAAASVGDLLMTMHSGGQKCIPYVEEAFEFRVKLRVSQYHTVKTF